MKRRAFLWGSAAAGAALAAADATLAAPVRAQELEGPFGATAAPIPQRDRLPLGPLAGSHYPDPHVKTMDKRFKGFLEGAAVERVATGFRFVEGPAYSRAGRYLIFSDIPNNCLWRLLDEDNHLSVYRAPSFNSNGNAFDRQGRLVTCEHSGRRVVRTEVDGSITVLADQFNGGKLNSPDDLAVTSDGSVWFSDPTYGIRDFYEGAPAKSEQPRCNLYRIDGRTGRISVVADDFDMPNGICFSPDEKKVYVVDTGSLHGAPHVRVFDADIERGTLHRGRVFADGFAPSAADGIRCDTNGNLWCGMGWGDPADDGVRCYASSGDLLGKIELPEICSNIAFGGPHMNRLYMCASTSVYSLYVGVLGL
jgi:gluconolactonase